ncbi:hypothetical protein [Dyella terrae]|uniref:hypothetical protein n=1 Tax=Dyella terrae TaxID=522259 RepID=UPI001EFD74F1|nr:hypothetical protein [Dyella terrae]ULU26804.1 hypothetical protein DYST_03752 [Dyella terrae]
MEFLIGRRAKALSCVAALALASASFGAAASTSYEIYTGKGEPECEYLAAALQKARIADMTVSQLCQTQQKPIEQWLKAVHIRDLAWVPYPTSDPVQLEKSMIESTIADKDLPKFATGIRESLEVMKRLSADDNYFFQVASLSFSGRSVYVLQLQQKRCPNVNVWSDTGIGNGLFSDKELKRGLGSSLLMPGEVISFFGKPATFSVVRHPSYRNSPKMISAQVALIIWEPDKAAGAGTRIQCELSIPSQVR